MTLVRDDCCDLEMQFREYARVAAVDAYNTAERWSIDVKLYTRSEVLHELQVAAALLVMVQEVAGDRFTHTCCGVDLLRFAMVHDAVLGRQGGAELVLPVFSAVFVGDARFDGDSRSGLLAD